MIYKILGVMRLCVFAGALSAGVWVAAQEPADKTGKDKLSEKSIGGKEHDANILGVTIGMDVPTALETVFINGKRKPGQEKPDAKRNEGKDNKDIRVVYKGLESGELQIVFAGGKYVKEIVLLYKIRPDADDLRIAQTGSIEVVGIRDSVDGVLEEGGRYDDRYSIGFTSTKKDEKYWWRDEKTPSGFRIRVSFTSQKFNPGTVTIANKTIVRKTIGVTPEDEAKFLQAYPQ